jgi:uncharacterized membrane protein
MTIWKFFTLAAPLALSVFCASAQAQTSPAEQVAGYVATAGQPAQAARGQEFFTTKHGKEWSCSTCHTAKPTVDGKHATTGKVIGPMAPAANAQRFTDAAKTEKWFRRNCNDVVGRECTPAEKADVITWLMSLKP